MGLRDRGYVIDYYMPLFSGVDSAKRARGRLTFPPGVYVPGDGGSGTPGGSGDGDGGFQTPIDSSIAVPVITDPSLLDAIVEPADSATSSAFSSDNGQTHVASRWMIQVAQIVDLAPTSQGTGIFIYDSGPTTSDLTTLPFADVGLQSDGAYLITVRHKGSGGGWSDWSLPVVFSLVPCIAPPMDPDEAAGLILWLDAADATTITEVAGRVSAWADKSTAATNATQATGALQPLLSTDVFPAGAMKVAGGEGMAFTEKTVTPGTVFMVVDWTTAATTTSIGLSKAQISSGDYLSLLSISPPQVGRLRADNSSGSNLVADTLAVPTGQHIVEFVLGATPATSYLYVDGVQEAASYLGSSWALEVSGFGLQATYVGNNNQIAEIAVYDTALSVEDRLAIRLGLSIKWGITI